MKPFNVIWFLIITPILESKEFNKLVKNESDRTGISRTGRLVDDVMTNVKLNVKITSGVHIDKFGLQILALSRNSEKVQLFPF